MARKSKLEVVQKFDLGTLVQTASVVALVESGKLHSNDVLKLVYRHSRGDWGECDEHDQAVNEDALAHEGRLLSAYTVRGVKLWVITESDRSSTTVLLPEDY